jgi:hypothetical protein
MLQTVPPPTRETAVCDPMPLLTRAAAIVHTEIWATSGRIPTGGFSTRALMPPDATARSTPTIGLLPTLSPAWDQINGRGDQMRSKAMEAAIP